MSSPFDAPATEDLSPEEGALAEDLHRELSRARPFQFGLSGCGLLVAVPMLVIGVSSFVAGLGRSVSGGSAPEVGLVAFLGLFYCVIGLVYGIPALLIGRSALALGGAAPLADRLRAAVRFHRIFWQVMGVLLAGMVLLYAVMVAGLLVVGGQLASTFDEVRSEIEAAP